MSIRRKTIAGLCFLAAALLAFHTGARFYLGRANPTESRIIRGKLDTLEIAVRLRVEEAKKAGYSEEEIADFLAKDNADSTNKVMVSLWKLELTVLFVATLVGIGVIILSP